MAQVNQGADLAAGEGIGAAVLSASHSGSQSFGAVGGGSVRHNTGSHVDVDGFSLMTGLSSGVALNTGRLTFGAFLEYGQGDYDTYNSFPTARVKGGGDTEYLGGGLLGRFDFAETARGHSYVEASGRVGRVESDFSSADLGHAGQVVKFDTKGLYYGLHVGAGHLWKVADKTRLEVYGKYLWSRQEGDSVRLSTGDPVKFADVDSYRLRGGLRFSHALSPSAHFYAGAAYEHEFDGKAKASTYNYAIDAPSMKGGTGIGEFGLTVKPGKFMSFDIGVQGYAGRREGFTGGVKLNYEF
jgi:hypothetical protein